MEKKEKMEEKEVIGIERERGREEIKVEYRNGEKEIYKIEKEEGEDK